MANHTAEMSQWGIARGMDAMECLRQTRLYLREIDKRLAATTRIVRAENEQRSRRLYPHEFEPQTAA